MKVKCENCNGQGRMYKKMGSMLDKCPICHGEKEVDLTKLTTKKMQEQKRYQIEKVGHSYISPLVHTCCLIDYSKKYDDLMQLNYCDINNALLEKRPYTVGMWRIKQQNLKQYKN